MKVLVTPVGSAGDNYPFIGLASELVRRGHDVHILATEVFRDAVTAVGARYVEVGTAEEYRANINNPELWHPWKGSKAVAGLIVEQVRRLFKLVSELNEPGKTLVVGHTLDFASRALHEKINLPLVSVHLQPCIVRTSYQLPTMIGTKNHSWIPHWMKRAIWWGVDRLVMDPIFAPSVNEMRASVGLPPVKRIFDGYLNSPLLTLGLWPDWFGPAQPDWPKQLKLTGFPLYDPCGSAPLEPQVDAFVQAGDAPIVFTPGSAMVHGQDFFAAAVEACQSLGRRGMLMTRYDEHVPRSLPANVMRFEFAPFSKLLPRCAALVHHGGIGTTAAGFAGGVPQVIMPMSHDQPDNADRAVRLGVARRIMPRNFTGETLATALRWLLASTEVTRNCEDLARRCRSTHGIAAACDLIESVMPRVAATPDTAAADTAAAA